MINQNKPIYSVYLVKREYTLAHRIMVQETSNEEEFQEIITNEKFKSTIIYKRSEDIFKEKTVLSNDKLTTPLLIYPVICEKLEFGLSPIRKTYRKNLNKATPKQLEEYLINNNEEKLNRDFKILTDKANQDFNQLTYDASKDNKKKIKRIIREYNDKTLRR